MVSSGTQGQIQLNSATSHDRSEGKVSNSRIALRLEQYQLSCALAAMSCCLVKANDSRLMTGAFSGVAAASVQSKGLVRPEFPAQCVKGSPYGDAEDKPQREQLRRDSLQRSQPLRYGMG